MRKALAVLMLFGSLNALAEDPARSIDNARRHIAAKDFAQAIDVLQPALENAASLPERERTPALAAVHFYMAVAFSGLGEDANARAHLKEFLRLSPKSNRIDASKYDRRFVALFNDLVQTPASGDTFEMYYPSFDAPSALEGTSDSLALEMLGTRDEKREWQSLTTSAEHARFIQDFWQRRDPNLATPRNEFRENFERRVAFADNVFGTSEQRGAASDRGKVFILLGRPSFVRRRAIGRADLTGRNRVWIADDAPINGTIEQWVYTRDQLPLAISKQSISYRFVTQPGIGVGVLAKEDAYAMQALNAATNPNIKQ